MSRLKSKELKTQFGFRVYDESECELIKRAIDKFQNKFDSLNDCIKYFVLIGADKMLGDNSINNNINFSEIRKHMQSVDESLKTINNRLKLYFVETTGEVLTAQALTNFITNIIIKEFNFKPNNFTEDWKYYSHDEDEVERLRDKLKKDLLDVRYKT